MATSTPSSELPSKNTKSSSTTSLISTPKTSTSLSASPLQDFTALNASVYLYQPTTSLTTTSTDPDVILLLGWMDGSPRHISKYTTPYRKLYPNTPIIVITTSIQNAVFSRTHQNITRITPVLTYLTSLTTHLARNGEEREPRVLLHSFSNGGGYSTMLILQQWRAATGRPLDIKAMILDSSPGIPTLTGTVKAMSVSLPRNFLLRALGVFMLRVLYGVFIVAYTLSRRTDWVTVMRGVLNNEMYVQKEGSRRVYVFSETDEMVDWRDVVKHADEAKSKGYEVSLEKFVGSGHVSHAVKEGEKYWGIVKRVWEESVRGDI